MNTAFFRPVNFFIIAVIAVLTQIAMNGINKKLSNGAATASNGEVAAS